MGTKGKGRLSVQGAGLFSGRKNLKDWKSVECLNAKPSKSIGNALKQGYREDDGLYVESDTDEQILIHIPFQSAVKLSSIFLKATDIEGKAPKTIKLFINQPTIGFSEASDSPGIESFQLDEKELPKGLTMVLKPVKYQRVNCLTLFVESNQGDEDTTIFNKLVILGSPGSSFDVSNIKDITKEQG